MTQEIRKTRSVCPVCLRNLPAALVRRSDGSINMEKTCPEHGAFSVPVWGGLVDFDTWLMGTPALGETEGQRCPESCGICGEHGAGSCCALLEVTGRCNLHCRFCFAKGGEASAEPSLEELKAAVRDIKEQCGNPLLQLSGGEPTLRNDLPELISYAKSIGFSYVQINTNGIRLAEEPEYAEGLSKAGADISFLQFDGTRNDIYECLRGAALLETKLKAIEVCGRLGMGVTLVPTMVRGVNTDNIGELVKLAIELSPTVKGIHFQPVSYFGRIPELPVSDERYTLDMLMADICRQTGIPQASFMPSRCDHPLCGFHSNYLILPDNSLRPLSSIAHSSLKRCRAEDNRDYVARHWQGGSEAVEADKSLSEEMDFDTFLRMLRSRSLTLTAMAFQDAMNLNIERLRYCSLHVYDKGKIKPFCARYLTPL